MKTEGLGGPRLSTLSTAGARQEPEATKSIADFSNHAKRDQRMSHQGESESKSTSQTPTANLAHAGATTRTTSPGRNCIASRSTSAVAPGTHEIVR